MNLNLISEVYAQTPAPAADAGANPPPPSPIGMFLPVAIVFVIFYFLILRPQQKQQKLKQQMINNVKRGDEIITNGGIHGKIVDIQEQTVQLQVAANVIIKLDRSQINVVRNETIKS